MFLPEPAGRGPGPIQFLLGYTQSVLHHREIGGQGPQTLFELLALLLLLVDRLHHLFLQGGHLVLGFQDLVLVAQNLVDQKDLQSQQNDETEQSPARRGPTRHAGCDRLFGLGLVEGLAVRETVHDCSLLSHSNLLEIG